MTPRFGAVSIDADSTLSGIEGIDWLAARREPEVAVRVAALTTAAMNGEISLGQIYGGRLSAVAPSRAETDLLARAYIEQLAPGAVECVQALRDEGVHVLIVSGGIWQALLPMARMLGLADGDVHAVSIQFGDDGAYVGYDAASPLTGQEGKTVVLAELRKRLPQPMMHVGDGMTDAVVRGAIDAFTAYTGFATREPVVARADYSVASFDELRALVVGRR